jgi:hypothetical protein
VKIEGKEVTLPDDVVKAGQDAIRAVLSANGFPGAGEAHIEIVGGKEGAPAIVKVAPRAKTKGGLEGDTLKGLRGIGLAREVVTIARFLASEIGADFDVMDIDGRLMLIDTATRIASERDWQDEMNELKSDDEETADEATATV